MKRCKDCKFCSHGCFDEPCKSCQGHNLYVPKWRKTLQAKVVAFGIIAILIWLALLLGGCVHVKQDDFEYWRFGSQQIGSALLTLPDGSELLLDGQKSELPKVEITATSITIGKLKP